MFYKVNFFGQHDYESDIKCTGGISKRSHKFTEVENSLIVDYFKAHDTLKGLYNYYN